MDLIGILLLLLFGALVGWLARFIMKSKSSLIWTIILGIVGSVVGNFIVSLLGRGRFLGSFSFDIINILISIGGACLVIIIARGLKLIK